MSKICENCGNMIPDGAGVCPGCGKEQYGDDALQSVLSELSFALDHIQEDTPEEVGLPQIDNTGKTIVFGADQVKKDVQQAKAPEVSTQNAESAAVAAAMGAAMDAPARRVEPAAVKVDVSEVKSTAKEDAPKKKKKKKKKKSSTTTVLGIIIGLIMALLVVAGGALFMLYKMGFFDLLSDEELLGANTTSVVEETMNAEMPSEAPVPEVPSVVEESVVEEAPVVEEASVAEEELSLLEEPVDEEGPVVTKFTLTGADDMTFVSRGQTEQIVYVISPDDAKWEIEWTSSDESIATVSNNGVIAARRGGDCEITGKCGDFEVTVKVHCAFDVPTTVLDMNYEDITMDHEGQEVQLAIDYELTDEQIEQIKWETTDETIATVDEDGKVTAIGDGTAVISASVGDYTASCIVRCVNVTGNKGVNSDDSEYVINYEDVTLTRKGEYFELSLKSVLGNDVPNFTWKSSDTKIATVDSDGIVTAVGDGTCKITTSIGQDDFECIVRVRISG